MSLSKDLYKKITLAIYDHKCVMRKANQMWDSLKEVEKTLDHLTCSKCRKGK
ncbi:MAG TPA: hypothetical protein IAB23_11680 [Candidatus Scybalocola faecavium]|nr:hypothetical protein [Candidatus Scybalocola faecavium]